MPIPFASVSPEQYYNAPTGVPDISKLMEGYFYPQMERAKIQQLQSSALKNQMLGKFLNSAIGGGSGIQGEMGQQQTQGTESSNLRAAILKGMFGIDPFLMSPQQQKSLEVQTSGEKEAQKQNIQTGMANVGRESLQGVASMPEGYLGMLGSVNMAKDLAAYNSSKDPEARKRLLQAAVAERLVPEAAGYQLGSQGIRATVPAIEHQRKAIRQGFPLASHLITENLPHDIAKEAERLHNQTVRDINRQRSGFLEGFANPNVRGSSAQMGGSERPFSGSQNRISWEDVTHTGQQNGMGTNEVIDMLARKHNMSPDEFIFKFMEKP